MAIFGKNPQPHIPGQTPPAEKDPQAAGNSDIAAAEYPYFHIHQIKPWAGWAVNQEEVDYRVDPPVYPGA